MLDSTDNLKNNLADVTAIIMTNNEEKHIERCLLSMILKERHGKNTYYFSASLTFKHAAK